jgi:hypothetical protein
MDLHMRCYSATAVVLFGAGIFAAQLSYSAEEPGSIEELLQQAELAIAKVAKPEGRIIGRTKVAVAFHLVLCHR